MSLEMNGVGYSGMSGSCSLFGMAGHMAKATKHGLHRYMNESQHLLTHMSLRHVTPLIDVMSAVPRQRCK